MTVWVDADSCPSRIREIVSAACVRYEIKAVFVANRPIPVLESPYSQMIVTEAGSQAADQYILSFCCRGDIAITRDIPLAYDLVHAGLIVLNDRGTVYTPDNVGERLSVRNFMYDLRSLGIQPERTDRFGKKDIQKFAGSLDRVLAQRVKTLQ